jgi:hypothetical protein
MRTGHLGLDLLDFFSHTLQFNAVEASVIRQETWQCLLPVLHCECRCDNALVIIQLLKKLLSLVLTRDWPHPCLYLFLGARRLESLRNELVEFLEAVRRICQNTTFGQSFSQLFGIVVVLLQNILHYLQRGNAGCDLLQDLSHGLRGTASRFYVLPAPREDAAGDAYYRHRVRHGVLCKIIRIRWQIPCTGVGPRVDDILAV